MNLNLTPYKYGSEICLNLSNKNLIRIPKNLDPSITKLDLSRNKITELTGLENLTNL